MNQKTGKIALLIISFLGMLVMGYLVSLHYSPDDGSTFCDFGEGLSCDIVNKSAYAKIFGIPMSILGFLYFLGIFITILMRMDNKTLRGIAFLSITFLGPSLYLTGIELFVLKNVCIFCELSKVLIFSIIGISFWLLEHNRLKQGAIWFALFLAIIFGFITYTAQSNVVPSGLYDEFAQCLTDKNMVMYGSITCSFCAKQRAMFGDAFEFATEIECDPRYSDDEEELNRCAAKNIKGTPTWILEDNEGNDVFRFDAGVVTLERLSEVSECPLPNTN